MFRSIVRPASAVLAQLYSWGCWMVKKRACSRALSTAEGRQLQPPTQFHRSRVTPFSNEQLASASSDGNVNESDSPNESGRARPRGWTVEGQGRRADRSTRWTHALSISADFCGVSRIKRTSKRPLFPLVILAQIPQLIYFDCAQRSEGGDQSSKRKKEISAEMGT